MKTHGWARCGADIIAANAHSCACDCTCVAQWVACGLLYNLPTHSIRPSLPPLPSRRSSVSSPLPRRSPPTSLSSPSSLSSLSSWSCSLVPPLSSLVFSRCALSSLVSSLSSLLSSPHCLSFRHSSLLTPRAPPRTHRHCHGGDAVRRSAGRHDGGRGGGGAQQRGAKPRTQRRQLSSSVAAACYRRQRRQWRVARLGGGAAQLCAAGGGRGCGWRQGCREQRR